jgi:hypothetical protein
MRNAKRKLAAGLAGLLIPVSGILTLAQAPVSQAATSAAHPWHASEIRLPLTAAASPIGQFASVACVAAKSCTGGGSFEAASDTAEAIIATESNGTWGRAFTLVMPKNLNVSNPDSAVTSVACPKARFCVAVGTYFDSSGVEQAFTSAQRHGTWQRAAEISRPADLAAGGNSQLSSVSCVSDGNCVAVGAYRSTSGQVSLAVRESGGHWLRAFGVRPPPGAAADPDAFLSSVSCWSPGHCVAVGGYLDKSIHGQAMAVTDTRNRWAQAARITPPANAGLNPDGLLNGVSCDHAGQCTAVGEYATTHVESAMATTKGKHGWLRAGQILPSSGKEFIGLNALSCSSATSCLAVGFAAPGGGTVPVVAAESGGRWGRAARISGPANAEQSTGRAATLLGIDCLKGNACAAVGWYFDTSKNQQAMAESRPAA